MRGGRFPAYLVLLRVGFTKRFCLRRNRCALTAPFHPYPPLACAGGWRYILCCTGRPEALKPPSRTLSGTLPCGVRTFLPRSTPCGASGSDHPAACKVSVTQGWWRRRGDLSKVCRRWGSGSGSGGRACGAGDSVEGLQRSEETSVGGGQMGCRGLTLED